MAGEWRERPLAELVEIFDGPHATPAKTESGPVFLGISNLANGRMDLTNTEHLSEEDYVQWTRRVQPMPGDVVFSYETRIGEAARVPEGLRCCLGRRMGLLRAKRSRVDARFLLYAYLGRQFQELLRSRTIPGSTVDRIPLIDMPKFPIIVPSDLHEQRAIAHILGMLDERIEVNRKMAATLEAMARAIFKDSLDQASEERRLDNLCDIFDGPHATPNTVSDGPIFLGISNLSDGRLDLSATRHVTEGDFVRWTKRVTPVAGDIVFSYETRLGEVARIPKGLRCCLGRRMGLLRPKVKQTSSAILLYAFLSPAFQDVIRARTIHGSTVDRIPLIEMGSFPIMVPEAETERRIAPILESLRERMEQGFSEAHTLAALRDTLLPKLISGDLRVEGAERFLAERGL